MAKKVISKVVAKKVSSLFRSNGITPKTKSVVGSALSQRERKSFSYNCPNCGSAKPTLRGRCPKCGYAGLK